MRTQNNDQTSSIGRGIAASVAPDNAGSPESRHVQYSPTERALILFQRVQLWLAASALVAMMLVTVVDVCMRYLFNRPVRGAYDFTEAMLVVFVFHGLALCFWSRSHIVIDLIDQFVSAATRYWLVKIADAVSLALLILLAAAMLRPAYQAYGYGDRKLELNLPLSVLWAVALAGMVGTILSATFVLLAAPVVPAAMPREGAHS